MCNFISSQELEDTINNVFSPLKSRDRGTIKLDNRYGDLKLNYFSTGNGITYSSFIGHFNRDTIMEGSSLDDMTFISFNMASSMEIRSETSKDKYIFDSNKCLQGKMLKEQNNSSYYSKGKQYMSHHITLDNNLFDIITSHKTNKQFDISLNTKFKINTNNFISNKQQFIINQLSKSNSMTNNLQMLFLESKILDLIYTTIDEEQIKDEYNKIYLSKDDIISLNKAKEILLEDISNPPSLQNLAKKIATNEFKLKKGFKQLFGNTVYGYLQEQRLHQAKSLLEKNDINVNEASLLVGYKSVGHFSKIFKEKFGVLASNVMKERKYYH